MAESKSRTRGLKIAEHVGSAFTALAVRDFRYLTLSNFSSQVGLWIQQVAEGWLAFEITGSATFLGAVAASRAIPSFILTLPGGVLADRWDRRVIIRTSQFVLMINAIILSFLVSSGLIQPWHLLAISVIAGVANAVNMPARQSLAPQLAGPDRIANAVALNSISFNVSRILGPSIAGFILAVWGIGPCYAVQAILLVIAMFWVTRVSPGSGKPLGRDTARGSMWANLVEGIRYIQASKSIRGVMAVAIIPIYLEMIYSQLLPVFADNVLHVGAPGLAQMVTAVGVGSMAGAFVTAGLSAYPRKGLVMLTVGMFSGFTLSVFALSRSMPLTVAMLAITGLTQTLTMAMGQTMVNLMVANEFRGRVMAVYQMLWSSSPIAMLPAGWTTDHFGASTTVMASGVLVIAYFLVNGRRRGVVRDFREESTVLPDRVLTDNAVSA